MEATVCQLVDQGRGYVGSTDSRARLQTEVEPIPLRRAVGDEGWPQRRPVDVSRRERVVLPLLRADHVSRHAANNARCHSIEPWLPIAGYVDARSRERDESSNARIAHRGHDGPHPGLERPLVLDGVSPRAEGGDHRVDTSHRTTDNGSVGDVPA